MRRILLGTASLALAIGIIATPHEAQAWWRGGYGFYGHCIIVRPPAYKAPPVYYAPPRAYVPIPPGYTCFAGPYICPLGRPTAPGATCTCPTNNGRAYGSAH